MKVTAAHGGKELRRDEKRMIDFDDEGDGSTGGKDVTLGRAESQELCRLLTNDGRSLLVTREGERTVARDGGDVVAIGASPEDVALALSGVGIIKALIPENVENVLPSEVVRWFLPVVDEGFCASDGEDWYAWYALRGLDGALHAVPWDLEEVEILERVDAAQDGGVVTWDDWEYICRLGNLYLVYRRGDVEDSTTPVGCFSDPIEGLRAAAAASTYFRFDEETGAVVKLIEDYETRLYGSDDDENEDEDEE
jgi:hypothetical protein